MLPQPMPVPKSPPPAPDDKLSLSTAAKMCGVDYDTMLRWVAKGVLPHVQVGPFHRKRVRRSDVDALIRSGS